MLNIVLDFQGIVSRATEKVSVEDFAVRFPPVYCAAQEPFRGREGVRELLGDAMSLPKAPWIVISLDTIKGVYSSKDAASSSWHRY